MSFFVTLQHLLPKQALTHWMGCLANWQGGKITQICIRWFIERYGVNMAEAVHPDPADYSNFNAFFTRALQPGVRPLADAAFVCPVDGAISQFGLIQGDQIFQAKGHSYGTLALVGGDPALAAQFEGGHFATLYLSPKDYHRIHMPAAAHLRRMVHVPGDLFSVNPETVAGVPGLFARNERVVCVFDMPCGPNGEVRPFVLVMVGATIVGSMATTWHGVVNSPRPGILRSWSYDDQAIDFARGDEMGRFMLGSTVILLWPRDTIAFNPQWAAGHSVRVGQAMGDAA